MNKEDMIAFIKERAKGKIDNIGLLDHLSKMPLSKVRLIYKLYKINLDRE